MRSRRPPRRRWRGRTGSPCGSAISRILRLDPTARASPDGDRVWRADLDLGFLERCAPDGSAAPAAIEAYMAMLGAGRAPAFAGAFVAGAEGRFRFHQRIENGAGVLVEVAGERVSGATVSRRD